ncbi:MAG: uroporphyrinogen decarboxylase family protein [Candidatus Helarchaeota archaeon]
MNSRELTLSAINGIPEKIPFNPFIMHLAASLLNVNYSHDYVQKPDILAEAQIKCSNFFGIDHVNVSTDAYREASAWGVEINFEGHTPVAISDTELNWKEFENIETPDLSDSIRIQNRVKAVKLLKEKLGSEKCVIGWIEAPFAELHCLFGTNVFYIAAEKNWDQILKNLMEKILPVQLEFAKLQIEAGADIIGAGDSIVSQIGPMRYEKSCLSLTQKLFKDIQKYVPVLYHTCGDNSIVDKHGRDMLKLLQSTGASVLDIDSPVDLKIAKEKIGDKICLRGNINTTLLGNPYSELDVIIQKITENIKIGKPNGRYMFAAGCEWPWEPLDMAIRNLSLAKAINEKIGYY